MDLDGVDITIIYPTVGFHCYRVADNELLNGIQRTYNDWIAEYCSAVPGRLNGIALINTDEVDNAIKEMERCKKMGLVGVMISAYPGPGKRYVNADYEPFWAAAEDLRMPLALHIGTNRPGPDNEFMNLDSLTSAFLTNVDHYVRMSIADMVFTGVFERHPNLYAGSIEQESAWVPHFLERMDFTYLERRGAGSRRDRFEFKDDKVPSDFWYSNMFVGFQEDAMGVQMKDVIGVDNIQFGADYPHDEGTFPKTRRSSTGSLPAAPMRRGTRSSGATPPGYTTFIDGSGMAPAGTDSPGWTAPAGDT